MFFVILIIFADQTQRNMEIIKYEVADLMRNGSNFHYTGTSPYSEDAASIYLPPMGRYNSDKDSYQFEGDYAYFWTSTTYGGWRDFVYGSKAGAVYYDSDNGLYQLSVRCVQDE